MKVAYLGIDLAKNIFQLHGVDCRNKPIFKKRLRRSELLDHLATLQACTVAIEACTGAFYWQRRLEALGHPVKVISPQYVKPFVRRQKNDGNDAESICTAVQQPDIRFVPKRSEEQQDIQALHRARQRLVNHRTALVCQIRGLLLDRGPAIGAVISRVRAALPEIREDAEIGPSYLAREPIAELFDFVREVDTRMARFDECIEAAYHA